MTTDVLVLLEHGDDGALRPAVRELLTVARAIGPVGAVWVAPTDPDEAVRLRAIELVCRHEQGVALLGELTNFLGGEARAVDPGIGDDRVDCGAKGGLGGIVAGDHVRLARHVHLDRGGIGADPVSQRLEPVCPTCGQCHLRARGGKEPPEALTKTRRRAGDQRGATRKLE